MKTIESVLAGDGKREKATFLGFPAVVKDAKVFGTDHWILDEVFKEPIIVK